MDTTTLEQLRVRQSFDLFPWGKGLDRKGAALLADKLTFQLLDIDLIHCKKRQKTTRWAWTLSLYIADPQECVKYFS